MLRFLLENNTSKNLWTLTPRSPQQEIRQTGFMPSDLSPVTLTTTLALQHIVNLTKWRRAIKESPLLYKASYKIVFLHLCWIINEEKKKKKRWKYYNRLAKIYLHRGFRHSELRFYITLTVHGISILQYKLTPADLVIINKLNVSQQVQKQMWNWRFQRAQVWWRELLWFVSSATVYSSVAEKSCDRDEQYVSYRWCRGGKKPFSSVDSPGGIK